jgi:hypothetical protein
VYLSVESSEEARRGGNKGLLSSGRTPRIITRRIPDFGLGIRESFDRILRYPANVQSVECRSARRRLGSETQQGAEAGEGGEV